MRLFIASGIFHPEAGGPATYLYHLLPALQRRGHDITALSFGDAPVEDYPYQLTRVPRRFYPRRQWEYSRQAACLWPGHDLVYAHTPGLPLPRDARPRVLKVVGDVAWERAMNKGWVAPDTDVDDFQNHRYAAQVEFNKRLRVRFTRNCERVIVPSEYLRQMVIGWGVAPERVTVIYNALNPAHTGSDASPEAARKMLNLPDGPLLLTAARLTPWKGVDALIRALVHVPDATLLVAGDGPSRTVLERLATETGIADRVIFAGRLAREQMAVAFRAADYTVLYSGYEGLPHTLLESLVAGTPVIASDKGGNPEVVTHDLNGLLVPYRDENALAQTLRQALKSGVRERLAANSSAGLDRFDWTRLVDETERVLLEVAGV